MVGFLFSTGAFSIFLSNITSDVFNLFLYFIFTIFVFLICPIYLFFHFLSFITFFWIIFLIVLFFPQFVYKLKYTDGPWLSAVQLTILLLYDGTNMSHMKYASQPVIWLHVINALKIENIIKSQLKIFSVYDGFILM